MSGILQGDCIEVMAGMEPESVDAVVTDPPYDLTSGKRGGSGAASVNLDSPYGRARIGTGNGSGGFMGKAWDSTGVAFDPATWREALRVLKPGGYLLAFGGDRTYHRLACAIDDAGFEIRGSLAYLFGSGFPKSLNVSKAIDKAAGATREVVGIRDSYRPTANAIRDPEGFQDRSDGTITAPATPDAETWQGWGTALKPAMELICMARKPLVGTVAANVLKYGTGAINVDACRLPIAENDPIHDAAWTSRPPAIRPGTTGFVTSNTDGTRRPVAINARGRWPANVVLDEEAAAMLDEQSGERAGSSVSWRRSDVEAGAMMDQGVNKMHRTGRKDLDATGYGDTGGASRFFFTAKASSAERSAGLGTRNSHPTVKPVALMSWLVRMVTPPGGTVLDPFLGSGSTAVAAAGCGFDWIGIERDPEYIAIAEQRLGLFGLTA